MTASDQQAFAAFCARMFARHPYQFRAWGGPPATTDRVPFDCGPGWQAVLERLFEGVDAALSANERDVFYWLDITRRYGALRTPAHEPPESIASLIDAAEADSEATCELCGAPGITRAIDGGFLTCCIPHAVHALIGHLPEGYDWLQRPDHAHGDLSPEQRLASGDSDIQRNVLRSAARLVAAAPEEPDPDHVRELSNLFRPIRAYFAPAHCRCFLLPGGGSPPPVAIILDERVIDLFHARKRVAELIGHADVRLVIRHRRDVADLLNAAEPVLAVTLTERAVELADWMT